MPTRLFKGRLARWALLGPVCLGLMLLACCGKKQVPQTFPPTTPTADQLSSSRLHRLVVDLQAMPEDQRGTLVERFLQQDPLTPIIDGETVVGFLWYGKAEQVILNGDLLHAWARPEPLARVACGENSLFFGIYVAAPDARLDYLLEVDGTQTADPRNPRVTPSGFGPHSEIVMPQFKPSPARRFREDIAHGSLESLTFTNLHPPFRVRTVKVYQPPGHADSTGLPVLYVYDGLEALEFMEYTNVLDNLIAERQIQPMVAVFIEMLPDDVQLFPDQCRVLTDTVCDELVPLIERTYKTARSPSERAVAGISAWGNLALTTAFTRPDVFAMAAGQSSTITEQLLEAFRLYAATSPEAAPLKIYLDVGSYDLTGGTLGDLSFLQANQMFCETLEQGGLRPLHRVHQDGHQWANWRERTDTILRHFFPPRTD